MSVSANSGRNVSFQYDGLDRRRSITVQDPVTGSTETRHLWCGTELCQARDANDAVIRRYYEDGEVRIATGERIYYGKDQIGSVRDAMDIATGAKLDEFDYEPYGQPTTTPASIAPDFRFAQMYYEPVSGLHLATYRAYDQATGRWLSRDPIEEDGGINLYAYALSNPLGFVDPSGLASCGIGDVCKAACKGVKKNIWQLIACAVCLANDKRPPPPPPRPPVPTRPVPAPPPPGPPPPAPPPGT